MDKLQINQLNYIYSYIASVYDAGKKLFDEFTPLIEYYFVEKASKNRSISLNNLTVELNEFYGIKIPKATLWKLLQTMQKENKVSINKDTINIIQQNLNQNYVTVREKLEGALDELYADFVDYFKSHNVEINKEEGKNLLFKLVLNYSNIFAEYYGAGKSVTNLELENADLIADYFNSRLNKNDALKHTFSALLIGAQKTALLNLKPEQLSDYEKADSAIQTVILDTNFALRLLKLQDKLNNDVANDTFCVLQEKGVRICILSITVTEMAQAISKYLQDSDPIVPGTREILGKTQIRFGGFYCAEQNGLLRSDLFSLTSFKTLAKMLEDKGIEVIYRDDFKYNKDYIESLKSWKNRITYSNENAAHDLKMIYYCEKTAKLPQGNIRILTNDARLTSWNANRMPLGNACITEMQLSSLFWIRGISKSLIVDNIVAALSDIHSWSNEDVLRFQKSFAHHASNGNITAENIDNLVDRLISAPQALIDQFDNENYELMSEIAIAKIEQTNRALEEGKQSAQRVQELELEMKVRQKHEQEKRERLIQKINDSQNKIQGNEQSISDLDNDLLVLSKASCRYLRWWLVFITPVTLLLLAGIICLFVFIKDYSLLGIIISACAIFIPLFIGIISFILTGKAMGFNEILPKLFSYPIFKCLKKYGYIERITSFKELRKKIKDKKQQKSIFFDEIEQMKKEIEKCDFAAKLMSN